MSMNLLEYGRVACLWERLKCCMQQSYGLDMQHIIQNNPVSTKLHADATDTEEIMRRAALTSLGRSESHPRPLVVSHPRHVLSRTFITQPCVVAAELLALEKLRADEGDEFVQRFASIAGHSLGELTALSALGVFTPETALHLAYIRGLLMENEFLGSEMGRHMLFACNPTRARLADEGGDAGDDMFFVLVELIGRALALTGSFIEVVNINVKHTQYIVAGDTASLAILGKCLDPQFRAQMTSTSLQSLVSAALSDVLGDEASKLLTTRINDTKVHDFVTSSKSRYGSRAIFRRFLRGPDDGFTPSLDELTHLTLEEDGCSGLKKKSWFIPLPLSIPFHSSRLRRSADRFLPLVRSALPDEQTLRTLLSCSIDTAQAGAVGRPLWVTNLTGTVFRPFDAAFQQEALEAMEGQNIGEVRHKGRYHSELARNTFSDGVRTSSVVDMCAAIIAAQIARPVCWTDVMDTMVLGLQCTDILEIAPQRTLADMFRNTTFVRRQECEAGDKDSAHATVVNVTTSCFP